MTNSKVFVVAKGQTLSSIKYQKDFHEGESIDLSHASDEDIAALVKAGAIVPAGDAPEVEEEVENG